MKFNQSQSTGVLVDVYKRVVEGPTEDAGRNSGPRKGHKTDMMHKMCFVFGTVLGFYIADVSGQRIVSLYRDEAVENYSWIV
jgi:hypothetical protein